MSITSGFYNSVNGDRKYNAEQLSSIFDGLITEGVFATCGEAFALTAGTGLRVTMAPGRAWLNHKWVFNDAPLAIDIPANTHPTSYRIHAIVLDVDTRDNVRGASVGVLSTNNVYSDWTPPMSGIHIYMYEPLYNLVVNTDERKQYIIGFVVVGPGETSIDPSNIFYRVGHKSEGHPYHPNFVTGIVDTVSSDLFLSRLESMFLQRMEAQTVDINAWFADLKATVSSNVAANLTSRLIALENGMGPYAYDTAEKHRNIYRGKNLGNTVTDLQLASIKDGTFYDLYVGDYWTIDGVNWVIADMDYWYGVGDTTDTKFNKHHLVIVPENVLYTAVMHTTTGANSGYVGSAMYKSNLAQAKAAINTAFSGLVLSHRSYFINAGNAYSSAGAWYDSTVDLMNEYMVYGARVYSTTPNSSASYVLDTVDKTQLAIFRLAPKYILANNSFWLRDIACGNMGGRFCSVQHTGLATYSAATAEIGVRPAFAIG